MVGEAGVKLDEHGVGLCPFHPDTTPSFRLRRDDDGVERWHCFPCGQGGDVYDFISRKEGLDFPDALTRAEELLDLMPAGWESNVTLDDGAITTDPAALGTRIGEARRIAQDPQNDGLMCVYAGLLDEDEDDVRRRAADRVLRDQWDWGVDAQGTIVIPHWSEPEGDPPSPRLMAVKLRSVSGFKWGEKGSKYDQLYGSWLPRRYSRVLICEGESDAVWASLQGANVDIRALPSGAGTLKEKFLEQAKQWDEVFLAFDADKAGIAATRNWIDALGPEKIRVCRLPRGKDLRDVKPDLKNLLATAVVPPPVPAQLEQGNGVLLRQTQNGPRTLASWVIEPIASLVPVDLREGTEHAFEVELTYAGVTQVEVMRASDLQSSGAFKKWVGRRGYDWLGTDSDVAMLQSWLTAKSSILPEVLQTARIGIHEAPHRYQYAGPSLVLPDTYIGQLPWKFVSPEQRSGSVVLTDDGPLDWRWLQALLALQPMEVMQPMLAWFAASARRPQLKNFPLLFVGGPSGSGKSTVVERVCRMFGSNLKTQLGGTSPFPLLRLLALTSSVPVFIDEWTKQSREDTRSTFKGAIPFVYAGEEFPRGQRDLSIVEYRCTSPVVVAGEDTFSLDREVDRTVTLGLTRTNQNFEALQQLVGQPLDRFGHWYNMWLLGRDPSTLPPLPLDQYTSRPDYNRAVLDMGWQTLLAFIEDASRLDPRVPELPRDLDFSELDRGREQRRHNEYEELLVALAGQTDSSGIDYVWDAPEGTYVRFQHVTSDHAQRLTDIRLPGGARAMRDYFERTMGHEIVTTRRATPLGHRVVSCALIRDYHLPEGD